MWFIHMNILFPKLMCNKQETEINVRISISLTMASPNLRPFCSFEGAAFGQRLSIHPLQCSGGISHLNVTLNIHTEYTFSQKIIS